MDNKEKIHDVVQHYVEMNECRIGQDSIVNMNIEIVYIQ